MREALHAFKFAGKSSLAGPLGDLLAEVGAALLPREDVDCLVPVPLHPLREAERGFNQSLLLARRVSRRWGIPVADGVLKRVRVTRPQTDLSARERRANVRGAFAFRRAEAMAGAHLLLIDDILTTGATVSECARVLLCEGRARAVGVLAVARVL
jgi:ComF family protein